MGKESLSKENQSQVINQILALIVDMPDKEFGILMDKLLQEQLGRNEKRGRNMDTIQV